MSEENEKIDVLSVGLEVDTQFEYSILISNTLFLHCVCASTDCTVGQHLIFAVPDSLVKATVNPLTHPTEVSNVSCTLQRLTSDPEVYIVPLDGCGINEHVRHTPAVCTQHTLNLKKRPLWLQSDFCSLKVNWRNIFFFNIISLLEA